MAALAKISKEKLNESDSSIDVEEFDQRMKNFH